MVTTIYVTRHGYRSNWVKDEPVPEPPTGISSDPVLSKHGVEQAEELGTFLSGIDPRIQRVYCSPFYRCIQTAAPACKLLDLDVYLENGIGEWYDRTRDTHPEPAPPTTMKRLFPGLVKEDYEPVLRVSTSGETIQELHSRCKESLGRLLKELRNEPEIKTILLVTHAAPKIAIGRALTGDPYKDIRTGVCSVDKFVLGADKVGEPGDWELDYVGKTDFLTGGEEMHWSFDIPFEPGSDADIEARRKAAEPQEEQVSFYIPLDMSQSGLGNPALSRTIPPQTSLQIVDLHKNKPLFKVGDAVYEGTWEDMVGTELFTDMEGRVFGKTRTRLVLRPGRLRERNAPVGNAEESYWSKNEGGRLVDKLKQITLKRREQEGIPEDESDWSSSEFDSDYDEEDDDEEDGEDYQENSASKVDTAQDAANNSANNNSNGDQDAVNQTNNNDTEGDTIMDQA